MSEFQTADEALGPERVELTLDRLIMAPRTLVWKAWTQPEHLVRWFFPDQCTLLEPEFDVRADGAYRCGFRAENGAEHWLRGRFLSLEAPHRLVFTFGWETEAGLVENDTRVTVTLADEGDRTRLTLHQTSFTTADVRDEHAEGWGQALDNLESYLAQA